MTNRVLPAGRPLWSGCATIDGLNSAADSIAYSWLMHAPMSRRRSSDSDPAWSTWPATRAKRASSSPTRSSCRALNLVRTSIERGVHLGVGQGQEPREHGGPPRDAGAEDLLAGQERRADHPRRVRPQHVAGAPDERARIDERHATAWTSASRPSCRVESAASVDSAPWFSLTPCACRPSNPPPDTSS